MTSNCELCKVVLHGDNDRTLHYQGKKHIRLAEQHKNTVCGVFITGFDGLKTKEELLQYFSKFGEINKTHIGPKLNYIIIVYETEQQAKNVVDTPHYIEGKKLVVEKRKPPFVAEIMETKKEDTQEHSELLQSLSGLSTLDMQIRQFIQQITPNIPQMIPIYHRVNIDMVETMKNVFPECNVCPFGSTTTSLQFKNSDIDIFVNIKHRPKSDVTCLKEAKKALHRCGLFRNILGIPSAKIPIIKCIHSKSGIRCDVNFRNMLGVKNSQLISYYLSLDSKLRYAMLVIKYWAKIHEISGRNHLFTNYSIVMMFIFYLQQQYSFPSVYMLQHNTEPSDPQVIWNMNILPTRSHAELCETKNVAILELLLGFFTFYSDFRYSTDIICPFLGYPVKKVIFSDIDRIPEEFHLYKINLEHISPLKYDGPICVQDPFELNINISSIIFQNILDKYVVMCKLARQIFLEKDERNMLYTLFSKKPAEYFSKVAAPDPEKYLICINMQNELDYLQSKVASFSDSSDCNNDLTKIWFKEVHEYIHTVFDKVLKFKLTKADRNHKNIKLNDQKDVHEYEENQKYFASCLMNLWDLRKFDNEKLSDKLEQCNNQLDKDILISDHIWTSNANIRPSSPLFQCEINISCHKAPTRVHIELVRIASYKKLFKAFAVFISSKLPLWFSVYEKDLNKLL